MSVGDERVYPGPRQILRYLRIEQEERGDGTVWTSTPVLPDLLDPGGVMRLGAIAPMCDVVAGALAAAEVAPDWGATLGFKLHLSAGVRSGTVEATSQILRAGRNTVLSESRVHGEAGEPAGLALVTFTRLPRREDQPHPRPWRKGRMRYALAEEEPRIPLDVYLGIRFDSDEDAFQLDHHERIENSFGSIQGGAMAALLERVAAYAGERRFGRPARTIDLHYSYTAQARVGPFRVNAEVLRTDARGVLSRVSLVDEGQSRRLAAVGTALAIPADA